MNVKHLLAYTILVLSSQAATAEKMLHKGEAFTRPGQTLKMPKGWESRAVRYDPKITDADLIISFGQQTYPAMHKLVEEYARKHNMKIVIQSGTCGVSAGKLLRKSLDSGTFCCPPGSRDRLPGLEFHTIAISALAIFVNKDNPVDAISTDQARQIFQGKIRNWQELASGNSFDNTIRPHARLHCKKRPGHWTLLLKNQELFSPILKEVGVIPDLVAKVGQVVESVSIETPYMINSYKKGPVKMLHIDGHAPTDIEYVASGQYPFYRTYSMTTWNNSGTQRDKTIQLITFLRDHIEKHYQQYSMVPISKLKNAGWKFRENELIAEPNGKKLAFIPPQH